MIEIKSIFINMELDILSSPSVLLFARFLGIDYMFLDQRMYVQEYVQEYVDFLFYL